MPHTGEPCAWDETRLRHGSFRAQAVRERQTVFPAWHFELFRGVVKMLWTIVVVLLILWALGLFVGAVGNLIHILLVIAIIVILVRVIQGRRPL